MDDSATILWLGLIASLVLSVRALVIRSWIMMWIAALGSLPFLLSSLGIVTLLLTSFQLASAGALRWHATAHGWVTAQIVSLLIWTGVFFSAAITEVLWLGPIPVLPLSLVAVLFPLLPVHQAQTQPS